MARGFVCERREIVTVVVYDCGLLLIGIRVVDCCLLFTLCGFVSSVLHSHAGIWERQVASFIFEWVHQLEMKGKEGKSRENWHGFVCGLDCALTIKWWTM